ncbi:hypothetical protein GCM10009430_32030 [Aquimarina litoralis]|uniref:histidine kinase n=1 Tax=Aquimarina litoralis TaxID=584605 RepID=A0ABN1J282_9FLAO
MRNFCCLLIILFLNKKNLVAQEYEYQKTIDSLLLQIKNNANVEVKNSLTYKIAQNYYYIGNNDLSKLYLDSVLLSSKDNRLKYRSFVLLQDIHRKNNNIKKRLEVLKELLSVSNKIDTEHSVDANTRVASYFSEFMKIDSAEFYINKIKGNALKVKNDTISSFFYEEMGILQSIKGEHELALENYLTSLEIRENNNLSGIPRLYNNIAIEFQNSSQFEQSNEYLKKALRLGNNENPDLVASCYYNMGVNFQELGEQEKAFQAFSKVTGYEIRSTNMLNAKAASFYNIGYYYQLKNQIDSSKLNSYRALDIVNDTKNDYLKLLILQDLSNSYLLENKLDSAKVFLNSTFSIIKENGYDDQKAYAFHLLAKIDSIGKDYKASLISYKEAIRIKDSLSNIKNSDKIKELQVQFATLEKEKEIESLNNENNAKELSLAKQKLQTFVLMVAVSFSFCILLIIIYRYLLKRKNNRVLQKKNDEIEIKNQNLIRRGKELERSIKDKEVLLKEIFHRVKNNLQLVSSMLNLQAENYNNYMVNDFVSRSQDRILSMSLVHQILYKGKDIDNVNFKQYLSGLMEAIKSSFDFTDSDIKFIISSDDEFYDIDVAIPLGIIINELVHNSMKYAFLETKEGKIEILSEKTEDGKTKITVSDDGPGFSKSDTEQESYGLRLVNLLVRQIKGKINFSSVSGTRAEIIF